MELIFCSVDFTFWHHREPPRPQSALLFWSKESRSVQRGRHDVSWKSFYNTYSHGPSESHTGRTAPGHLRRTSSWSICLILPQSNSAPVFSAPSGLSSIRLISQSNEQTPDKSCSVLCDWASVFWVNASLLTGLSSGCRMLITALWALLGSLHLVEMFASVRAS